MPLTHSLKKSGREPIISTNNTTYSLNLKTKVAGNTKFQDGVFECNISFFDSKRKRPIISSNWFNAYTNQTNKFSFQLSENIIQLEVTARPSGFKAKHMEKTKTLKLDLKTQFSGVNKAHFLSLRIVPKLMTHTSTTEKATPTTTSQLEFDFDTKLKN